MASFKKLKSGWQYRVSYKKDDGTYGTKSENGFATKKEAQLAAAKLEEKSSKGLNMNVGNQLFVEYYREWLDTYKFGKHSKATDKQYSTALKLVEKHFPNETLNQMTKMKYQAFLNIYAENHTKETVRKVHNQIAACLKDAFRNGHIPVDVTYKVMIRGEVEAKKESEKYLNEADAKRLLHALREGLTPGRVNRYMLILQLATGARIGEIMALTFDCIDFQNNTIRIEKTWDYKFTKSFRPTKNKKNRTVSVDEQTMTLMKELYNDVRKRNLKSSVKNTHNLLFADKLMQPPSVEGTNKMLRNLCKKIGLPVITSHNLRHTHASILLFHGLDLHYIADRLGDTVEVVTTVYAHLLEEMKDKGDRMASDIFANVYQESAK